MGVSWLLKIQSAGLRQGIKQMSFNTKLYPKLGNCILLLDCLSRLLQKSSRIYAETSCADRYRWTFWLKAPFLCNIETSFHGVCQITDLQGCRAPASPHSPVLSVRVIGCSYFAFLILLVVNCVHNSLWKVYLYGKRASSCIISVLHCD